MLYLSRSFGDPRHLDFREANQNSHGDQSAKSAREKVPAANRKKAASRLYTKPVFASLSPGHVGWGISWYINGLLIPEINVVRGRRYTFVVEGGLDPETPARYHPFYITDDPIGGYHHKTPEEKAVNRLACKTFSEEGSTRSALIRKVDSLYLL